MLRYKYKDPIAKKTFKHDFCHHKTFTIHFAHYRPTNNILVTIELLNTFNSLMETFGQGHYCIAKYLLHKCI